MVTVSLSGRGGIEQAEAYQLIPLKAFSGATMCYAEKSEQPRRPRRRATIPTVSITA